MNLAESFMTAISSLNSNKLRSFLTMLGVIIGVASVVAMVSVGEGARTQVTSQIGNLGSNLVTVTPGRMRALPGMAFGARGGFNILTYSHFLELKQETLFGATAILAESSTRKVIRYGKNSTTTMVIGTTPEYCDAHNFHVQLGRFFSQYDLDQVTSVAVLGSTAAEDLFGAFGAALNNIIRIGNVNFRVIGVMESKTMGGRDLGDQVFVPITTAQTRLIGNRYLQSITVQASSNRNTNIVYDQLYRFFLRKLKDPEKFTITNQQDILNTIENVTGTFTLLLGAITGISLLVGGIGIMNIMLVSVAERTREIGLRKAVGARPRDILIQFMIESSTLSGVGGIVGILAGAGLARLIARFSSWTTTISLSSIAIALGVSIGVGLFFGIYPARRASHLSPITALRYE
ncbi:MAG TPA: FtsX-like permease family protein [Firmicutes bacterium]|nr:FtsX-like permease family protein [Bacillota bacterium]